MNCTQETYRQCLAIVAPGEVAAARAAGVYTPNWNKTGISNHPNTDLRNAILDALSGNELTTKQIRARVCATNQHTHGTLCKMRDEGLVRSTRVVIAGLSQDRWRLV